MLLCSYRKRNNNLMWINIFLLSIIAGARDISIGSDTISYYNIYNYIHDGSRTFVEYGWFGINKFIQYIGGNFSLLLWITSLLTLIPVGILSKRYTPNPSLGLFVYDALYAYLNSFNIMRQLLAMSFVLLAYSALDRKKMVSFTIYVLVAISIHISSIFVLTVFCVKNIKLNLARVIMMLLSTLVIGCIINNKLLTLLVGPYVHYLDSRYRDNLFTTLVMGMLSNLVFILIYITSKVDDRNNIFMKIYFLGIVFMNITLQLTLGTRFILYFTIVQFLVFPIYLESNRFKQKNIVKVTLILYAGIIFMKILLMGNSMEGSVYPYQSALF